jgi:hypothetical protein
MIRVAPSLLLAAPATGLAAGTVLNAVRWTSFITADFKGGRLPEVIARGEPAIMVCHWPGIYFNGEKVGFNIFKQIVERLHARYDNLIWMKLSEIARYWAAKELTRIEKTQGGLRVHAPFASPLFTIRMDTRTTTPHQNLWSTGSPSC